MRKECFKSSLGLGIQYYKIMILGLVGFRLVGDKTVSAMTWCLWLGRSSITRSHAEAMDPVGQKTGRPHEPRSPGLWANGNLNHLLFTRALRIACSKKPETGRFSGGCFLTVSDGRSAFRRRRCHGPLRIDLLTAQEHHAVRHFLDSVPRRDLPLTCTLRILN